MAIEQHNYGERARAGREDGGREEGGGFHADTNTANRAGYTEQIDNKREKRERQTKKEMDRQRERDCFYVYIVHELYAPKQ